MINVHVSAPLRLRSASDATIVNTYNLHYLPDWTYRMKWLSKQTQSPCSYPCWTCWISTLSIRNESCVLCSNFIYLALASCRCLRSRGDRWNLFATFRYISLCFEVPTAQIFSILSNVSSQFRGCLYNAEYRIEYLNRKTNRRSKKVMPCLRNTGCHCLVRHEFPRGIQTDLVDSQVWWNRRRVYW